jgi:hypothetical protein
MRADTVRKLLLLAGDFQTQLFANFFQLRASRNIEVIVGHSRMLR